MTIIEGLLIILGIGTTAFLSYTGYEKNGRFSVLTVIIGIAVTVAAAAIAREIGYRKAVKEGRGRSFGVDCGIGPCGDENQ